MNQLDRSYSIVITTNVTVWSVRSEPMAGKHRFTCFEPQSNKQSVGPNS